MSNGEVKIKITVDGKPVHEATKSLKDFEAAAKGVGKSSEEVSKKTGRLDTSFKSLAVSLGLVKIASAAFNVLKDSVGAAVKRFDALQAVPKVLQALGASSEDSEKSIKRLAKGIEGLPTSLDEIASTMKRMFLVFRDADKATDSALALNNALLASGTSGGAAQAAMEQYLQALQKGKPDMMEWRSMQSGMVVALDEIARQSGVTVQELGANLRTGKMSMSDFNDMLITVAGSTGTLGDLAKTMTAGIGTSFSNLKLAVTKGLANIITSINDALAEATGMGIAEHIDSLKATINVAFSVIGKVIAAVVPIVLGVVDAIGFVIDVLQALSPIVYGAVAAFAAFHAITLAMRLKDTIWFAALLAQEAILKLTTATTAATASTGLLSKAMALLKTTLAANPYMAAALAIGAVVTAVILLVKAQKSFNSEAAQAKKMLKELTEANKKHAEAVSDTVTAYNEEITKLDSRKLSTSQQIALIDELSRKEDKSAEDKMLLADMVAQLNSEMEGLNLTYDAEADALNMSTDAIEKRMSSLIDVEKYNTALSTQSVLQQDIADNDLILANIAEQKAKYEAQAAKEVQEVGQASAYLLATLEDLQEQEQSTMATRADLIAQQEEVNSTVSVLAPIVEKIIAKQEKQKRVVGGLAAESEDLAKETKAVTEAIKKNSKEYDANVKKVESTVASSKKLNSELGALLSKEKLSSSERARAQIITDQLNAANKGLNLTYNAQSNSLNMSSEERQRRIDLIAAEASYSGAMERLLQIEEDKYAAEARLAELAGFRKTYNEMMASGIPISQEQAEAFAALFAEEDALKGQTYLLGLQYDETMGVLEGSASRIESLKLAYEKLTEEQQEALDGLVGSMQDYQEQSQNIFDKIETGTKTSWKEIQKTLKHNATVMSKYWVNIGILMEKGVDAGIIQQLIDAGVKAAPEADALAKKASLGKDHVAEINDTYTEAGKIPEDVLVAMMKGAKIPVTNETKALVQEIAAQMMRETGSVDWAGIAAKIPEGLVAGAYKSDTAKGFVKDVGRLASDASAEFQNVAMIKSPSKVFAEHGRNLIRGLASGIDSEKPSLLTKFGTLASSLLAKFASFKADGETIGKNIALGVRNGINKYQAQAVGAAHKMANNIPSVVRKTLQLASPSKVMIEIGKNVSKGLGVGIEKEEKSVLSNMVGVMESMTDAVERFIVAIPMLSIPSLAFSTAETAVGSPALAYSGAAGIVSGARVRNASSGVSGSKNSTADTLITGNQFVIREEADIVKVARELENLRIARSR